MQNPETIITREVIEHFAVLLYDGRSALETVGLDPKLGFLCAVHPGGAASSARPAGGIPLRDRRPIGAYADESRAGAGKPLR